MIFDTHAHYEDEAFDEDRGELIGSFSENGVGAFVNVASTWDSLEKTRTILDRFAMAYAAYGIHPDHVGELTEERMEILRSYCQSERCVAVGEIGLDYYWNKETRDTQIYWYKRQLALARELHLPVNIHSREAAADTMQIAIEEKLGEIGGIVHCYSYSVEHAKEYVKMGMYLGIGGVVTFKNARKLKETVAAVPLDRIVLETDSPYLAPVPNRGKRNSSLNLKYVVEAIAEIKGVTAEEVEAATWKNAVDAYRL